MITIRRRDLQAIRAAFRSALSPGRAADAPLLVQADGSGLVLRASVDHAAIACRLPGSFPPESLRLPLASLDDCQGRGQEPVTLQQQEDHVLVEWRDGAAQQLARYDMPAEPDELRPPLPEVLAENSPRLLAALHQASSTTESQPGRYALGCVQLAGPPGRLAATDARQLLLEEGFCFPWDGEILLPACRLFAAPQLRGDQPLRVGRAGDWFVLQSGGWTFHRRLCEDGRYPRVADVVPAPAGALATLEIADADAAQLTAGLRELPAARTGQPPLTLHLDSPPRVCCTTSQPPRRTQWQLSRCRCEGRRLQLRTASRYLARALALGYRRIEFHGPHQPAVCRDGSRLYLWMMLGEAPAEPVTARVDCHTPQDEPSATSPCRPIRPWKRSASPAMSAVTNPPSDAGDDQAGNRPAPRVKQAEPGPASGSAIPQAEALRDALQDALNKSRELIRALKRHRKQSRIVESTLASLRQLQAVGQ